MADDDDERFEGEEEDVETLMTGALPTKLFNFTTVWRLEVGTK